MSTSPVAVGALAGALCCMGTSIGAVGNCAAPEPLTFLLRRALCSVDVDPVAPPWTVEWGFGMAAPLRAGGAVVPPRAAV